MSSWPISARCCRLETEMQVPKVPDAEPCNFEDENRMNVRLAPAVGATNICRHAPDMDITDIEAVAFSAFGHGPAP